MPPRDFASPRSGKADRMSIVHRRRSRGLSGGYVSESSAEWMAALPNSSKTMWNGGEKATTAPLEGPVWSQQAHSRGGGGSPRGRGVVLPANASGFPMLALGPCEVERDSIMKQCVVARSSLDQAQKERREQFETLKAVFANTATRLDELRDDRLNRVPL